MHEAQPNGSGEQDATPEDFQVLLARTAIESGNATTETQSQFNRLTQEFSQDAKDFATACIDGGVPSQEYTMTQRVPVRSLGRNTMKNQEVTGQMWIFKKDTDYSGRPLYTQESRTHGRVRSFALAVTDKGEIIVVADDHGFFIGGKKRSVTPLLFTLRAAADPIKRESMSKQFRNDLLNKIKPDSVERQ